MLVVPAHSPDRTSSGLQTGHALQLNLLSRMSPMPSWLPQKPVRYWFEPQSMWSHVVHVSLFSCVVHVPDWYRGLKTLVGVCFSPAVMHWVLSHGRQSKRPRLPLQVCGRCSWGSRGCGRPGTARGLYQQAVNKLLRLHTHWAKIVSATVKACSLTQLTVDKGRLTCELMVVWLLVWRLVCGYWCG